jgi:hypothetical protein
MHNTLAILVTMTTYGTWLRGDRRGWVDDGVIFPSDPGLEATDRQRMKHPVFLFDPGQFLAIGEMIGGSLRERLGLRLLALTVQTWHVHTVVAATKHPVERIVKCVKDAARWGLRPGRPIWSDGYDKRFCFDEQSVHSRIEYVERHNSRIGLSAKPWGFLELP